MNLLLLLLLLPPCIGLYVVGVLAVQLAIGALRGMYVCENRLIA